MGAGLAVVCAALFGLNSLPAKALAEKGWRAASVGACNFGVAGLALAPAAWLLGRGAPQPAFWLFLAGSLAGNLVAFILYYRALALGDLSLVMPLVSLSPLFMLLTSWLMLGERLSPAGMGGVGLVVAGAWLLGCRRDRAGWLAPFSSLAGSPAARRALVVAFIWSITSNLDKRCVQAADPLTYPAIFSALVSAIYAALAWSGRRPYRAAAAPPRQLALALAMGLVQAAMIAAQMTALTLLAAPAVIAIKRSGMLVGVAAGWWRGEPELGRRSAGAGLILAGVVTIILAG